MSKNSSKELYDDLVLMLLTISLVLPSKTFLHKNLFPRHHQKLFQVEAFKIDNVKNVQGITPNVQEQDDNKCKLVIFLVRKPSLKLSLKEILKS